MIGPEAILSSSVSQLPPSAMSHNHQFRTASQTEKREHLNIRIQNDGLKVYAEKQKNSEKKSAFSVRSAEVFPDQGETEAYLEYLYHYISYIYNSNIIHQE